MSSDHPSATPLSRIASRLPGPSVSIPLLALAAILVVVALTTVAFPETSCRSCHRSQQKTLAASAHSGVGCRDCHGTNATSRLALSLHRTGGSLRSAHLPATVSAMPNVTQSACLRCHSKVLDGVVEKSGLRFSHADCVSSTDSCAGCHGSSLHTLGGSTRTPQMDWCLTCHRSIKRTEGCELCHADRRAAGAKTTWTITHGATWKTTHGAGDLSTCSYCHKEADACSKCHVQMPHPSEWISNHGSGVKADRRQCVGCHKNAFCDSCHGIQMPHPSNWLPVHPKQTKGYTDARCTKCHLSEDCDACHTRHVHPGLKDPKGMVAR